MTQLYLAGNIEPSVVDLALDGWDWTERPIGLLASFAYRRTMEWVAGKPTRRILDSGAYTAYQRGAEIDLDALVAEILSGRWDEAVALDVIGDPEASLRNAEAMAAAGADRAMPVFHIGDPWDLLAEYVARWPKVGLSCRFGEPVADSLRFYDEAFARAWPARFHSFGWVSRDALLRFPFHSADAATWQLAAAYGQVAVRHRGVWRSAKLPIPRGGASSSRYPAAIRSYLEAMWSLQAALAGRWRRELAALEGATS